MEVIIAIDDLHPEKGWGCEGDESIGYLEQLNQEFGCKFTLFIPANYHEEYPVSKHKDWVDWWLSKSWAEIASHGYYHKVFKYKFEQIGDQEFLELNYQESKDRTKMIFDEWDKVGYKPKGFRMPGWGCNHESAKLIGENFKWVAAHNEINFGIDFGCDTYYGCDGIHETENINLWDNRFMFQSHIAGDWNDNCWNEKNYLNFREVLRYLSTEYDLSYKTLSEL